MNYKLILFAVLLVASYVGAAWAGSRKYRKMYEEAKRKAERFSAMYDSAQLSLNNEISNRIKESRNHLAFSESLRFNCDKAQKERDEAVKQAEEFKKLYTDELAKNWALVQKYEKVDILVDMPDVGMPAEEAQE